MMDTVCRLAMEFSAKIRAMGSSISSTYGRSKLMVEEILTDLAKASPHWSMAVLRYFNPIGAHPSGLIGEDLRHSQQPAALYCTSCGGRRNQLQIFGGDYETPDGTGVRDYIHVVDLARGHVKALEKLQNANQTGVMTVNLGTGKGFSVLDVLHAFEKACGKPIPYYH